MMTVVVHWPERPAPTLAAKARTACTREGAFVGAALSAGGCAPVGNWFGFASALYKQYLPERDVSINCSCCMLQCLDAAAQGLNSWVLCLGWMLSKMRSGRYHK